MSSLDRVLAGEPLLFHLAAGAAELLDGEAVARSGRSARTLVKEGPLRVTLIGLAAGGELAAHHAEGPITVHVLTGAVRFHAQGRQWRLEAGDLLSLPAGVEHSVDSESGGEILVTVAQGG